MNITSVFIKVVNVQLKVSINTNITETSLNDLVLNKDEITDTIKSVFQLLENENPKFIIFPEYSFFSELQDLFIEKSRTLNSIIISGSYISTSLIPEAKVFLPDGSIDIIQKNGLAPEEHFVFPNITLKEGGLPNIFSFKYDTNREIKFLILICYDFYSQYHKFYGENLDFLFITAYNKNFEKFYSQLNEFCCKVPSFCIYSNVADDGAGNSAVFGIHEENIHQRNIANGSICDGKEKYDWLIANFNQLENKMMILELDINRPYLIRPFSLQGNNTPNVINIRKIDI